jgi:hypothetical protein
VNIGNSSVLGLAVGERSIIAAEVSVTRDKRQVKHTAEFIFPEASSLEKPAELGTSLAQFLRQNHFSSSRAVIGVPARWLMARDKDLPPATAEVAASALRLQAERHSSADDLVFDYAGQADTKKPRKVLLAAMLRPQMEKLQQMADAAGLRLLGITSATLALASANPASSLLLTIAPDAMELTARHDGTPILLRHLASSNATEALRNGGAQDVASMIGSEIRRVVTMMPQNGEAPSQSITLWDSLGLSSTELPILQDRAGLAVDNLLDLKTLGIATSPDNATRYAPAIALALAAAEKRLPLDFLHSRLATKKQRKVGRHTVWAAVMGVVAVALIVFLFVDVQQRETDLVNLRNHLTQIQPEIKSAEGLNEKVSFGRGWFETRPAMLESLREITRAFRDEEPIWVSSFTLRDTHKGTLKGKAADRKFILDIADRLQKNKNFSDVRYQELREVSGNSRDVSFSLNFIFNPTEQAP